MLTDLSSLAQLRGEIGWSTVSDAGISAGRGADGQRRRRQSRISADDRLAERGRPPSPDSADGDQPLPGAGLARSPLDERARLPGRLDAVWTTSTRPFRRLILVELLVTAGLLILLGATASLVIRRELRPLESMATAADDIARGDLNRRVDESDPSTEIGRLGVAFNDMLDGISTLLDERRRSEHRLRQFVADASHELRTPVAAVRGYTDLYEAGALPDERRRRPGHAADGLRGQADGRAGRRPADADPGRRRTHR